MDKIAFFYKLGYDLVKEALGVSALTGVAKDMQKTLSKLAPTQQYLKVLAKGGEIPRLSPALEKLKSLFVLPENIIRK
ncbi:MAG: hypothetical protein ABIM30_00680 [candidate division WOR-3 bacterium]